MKPEEYVLTFDEMFEGVDGPFLPRSEAVHDLLFKILGRQSTLDLFVRVVEIFKNVG